MAKTTNPTLTRRQMLKKAGVLGPAVLGLGAAAVPMIIPSSVLGNDGAIAPSNTVTLGVIGSGGKARHGMQNFKNAPGVKILAVADPIAQNREAGRALAGIGEDSAYIDFRQLVDRDDIDAVLVGTPDHWHVLASLAVVRSGKDVYCEKPLSNTVTEGRALADAVKRYGAVFQHGTQLKSLDGTRRACELVRNGYIGELKQVTIGSPPGQATGVHPEQPVPDWLDYDLWLGPAPMKPYTPSRIVPLPGWYFISDYSKAGWIAGYAVHDVDIAQWGMGAEYTGPVEVEGTGVFPSEGLFDTVLGYELELKYANGVKLVITDTSKNRHGVKFEGTEGWVFTRGGIEVSDPALLQVKLGPNETHLYRSLNHEANFIECVRSRAETITPIEIAQRSTTPCLLGAIAIKLGRRLFWNPEKERFKNDPEANRLLTYAMRDPWRL